MGGPAYAPLVAEPRADDASLQMVTTAGIILVLALGVVPTRRSPTRQPLEPA